MKHLSTNITVSLLLILVFFMHASTGSAEEPSHLFSLGGGSLTTAPSDAKAPELGVVTARYGIKIAKDFIPFFGTGLAYTYQPDTKTGDISRIKTGMAAQFGFDYHLGINSTLKLDYKYLTVSPEQTRGDSRTPPQSLGIGLDIKF